MCDEFMKWRDRLHNGTREQRAEAAESPPHAEVDAVVGELIRALSDSVGFVRVCAAEALGMYATTESQEALRAQVKKEKDCSAKAYSLSSLGLIANIEDIPILMNELRRSRRGILRLHSALALLYAARGLATEVLCELLEDGDSTTRLAAANYLSVECGMRDIQEAIEAVQRRLLIEPVAPAREAMATALTRLKNRTDDDVRVRSVRDRPGNGSSLNGD